jgi:hypothetical protein
MKAPWLPVESKSKKIHYSKPLSDILPDPDGKTQSQVPSCAVFAFDATNLVKQLGIYMDRWQMAADLYPGDKTVGKGPRFPTP